MILERSALKMGDFHTLTCEDFFISTELTSSYKLIAVMDGCTMATESAFASMLVGKALRKTAKEIFYLDFVKPKQNRIEQLLKMVIKTLFGQLTEINSFLDLDKMELMTTLLLGVVDFQNRHAELLVIGDGLIVCDGKLFEFDQYDHPDYLGYHLSESFEAWYCKQKQFVSISNFTDLSICTDGIYSFKNYQNSSDTLSYNEIIECLLIDDDGISENNFFEKRILCLQKEKEHFLTDDLAIIRLKLV